jgi:undecaprenyl-diphosphatase
MPEIIKVLLLAIVEGITEFLPISSTGHLIVASRFLELPERYRNTFGIFIQLGAVVAVILFYRAEIWQQARSLASDERTRQFWLKILLAFVPAAAIGFLFNDLIDQYLFNSFNVALALIVGGVFFIIVERWRPQAPAQRTREEVLELAKGISFRQALLIGIWQIIALFPGMSRSGMTIMGGMIHGVARDAVTMFTFYLSIPTLGIATVYALLRDLGRVATDDLAYMLIGAVMAGVVAWFSIGWLLRYVSRNTFVPFGIYRIVFGILIIALAAGGIL